MRTEFIRQLEKIACDDPRIFLITADLGFGVLEDFAKKHPRQYLNVGVAEQNMMGVATGLALEGRIVYVYSIGNFPTLRCLEQLRNDAAYHQANVKIVSVGGGFSYGSLGFSHHATEDLSILRALPITLVAPGDLWEASEATRAIADTPGTCYLRLDKSSAGKTNRPGEKFLLGKARLLRMGTDFTLLTTGGILGVTLKASEQLEKQGIHCRVIHMHTLKPLDAIAVAEACQTTGGIVTIEENTVYGGLGSAVAEICLESGVTPNRFYRIGLRDGFSTIVGDQNYLRMSYDMDEKAIVDKVQELLLYGKKKNLASMKVSR